MKRKRIVVMGFMGSMPIAGVIWQHIHYVVGLQRLGCDVYYIEDSARLPYNPQTFEVNNEFDYAAQVLDRLSQEFGFRNRWGFCARYLPRTPTAGLPLKRIRQLYREADAILNICGTQELNDDLLASDRILYIESDPGVEQIKIDKRVESTVDYLRRHHALFTFGENIGTKSFPVPTHGFKWLPTRQPVVTDLWKMDRSLPRDGCFYVGGELVDQRVERHYLAGQEISLEQIARIFAFHIGTEKIRGAFRIGDEHRRCKDAEEILAQRVAPLLPAPNERRLLALSRLHPPLEG